MHLLSIRAFLSRFIFPSLLASVILVSVVTNGNFRSVFHFLVSILKGAGIN